MTIVELGRAFQRYRPSTARHEAMVPDAAAVWEWRGSVEESAQVIVGYLGELIEPRSLGELEEALVSVADGTPVPPRTVSWAALQRDNVDVRAWAAPHPVQEGTTEVGFLCIEIPIAPRPASMYPTFVEGSFRQDLLTFAGERVVSAAGRFPNGARSLTVQVDGLDSFRASTNEEAERRGFSFDNSRHAHSRVRGDTIETLRVGYAVGEVSFTLSIETAAPQ